MDKQKEVSIICKDGFNLAGTLYQPEAPKAAVMIAPATGIKKKFYQAFAEFLCQQGYGVLTFDNRGIGKSKGENINSGNPTLINWGKLDMSAALDFLKNIYPDHDYHLIGHSAGGQLVGLMDNSGELSSMFNVGCSSGSMKNLGFPFILQSHFYLNFVIPVSNFLFGHTKSQWFGMGEPLPKEVASQWRKWCNGSGYVKVHLDTHPTEHLYDTLDLPSLWVHALDDDIANLENVKDMLRVYSAISYKIISLQPKDWGYTYIGHMKFFSAKRKKLWKYATDWLSDQGAFTQ